MSLEPVDRIVGYKIDKTGEYFEIQWGKNDTSWEPLANLHCPRIMKEFTESLLEIRRNRINASKFKKVKKTGSEDGNDLKFQKIKKESTVPVAQSISNPGVSNRYSNINSYNQAIEKPASIRDMFAKNNRYAEYPRYSNYPPDNRRMSSAGAYFGGQYNSPQHAPYGYNYVAHPAYPPPIQGSIYPPQPIVYSGAVSPYANYGAEYYPEPMLKEEDNDDFSSIPSESLRPKSGVLTELIVNKFDLGEIRFAWLSGSLDDDHTLPPAIYLTKVMDWSKVFVLLMSYYMDPSNSSMDIFSVAPANNHDAFGELVSTLTNCHKAAIDWASSDHIFIVFPLFESLKQKFNISVTENSSMICLKVPSTCAQLGDISAIEKISSVISQNEAISSWLMGSPRYHQELESACIFNLNDLSIDIGSTTFAVFAPNDSFEIQEACKLLVAKKATYAKSFFLRSINLVLISESYLQFLHTLPNLIQLKWRQVRFYVLTKTQSPSDLFRFSFKNILPKGLNLFYLQGGVVTVTKNFLLDKGLDSFTSLIKWTQSSNSNWIIRISPQLYEDFGRFIAQFVNSVSFPGFLFIQNFLQGCVENFFAKSTNEYIHRLEHKYSATHRHFIIIDHEPFSFTDSSSVQVLTASKLVEMLRTTSY